MGKVSVTAVVIRAVQVLLVSLRPSVVRLVSAGICFSLRDVLTRTERTLLFLGGSFFSPLSVSDEETGHASDVSTAAEKDTESAGRDKRGPRLFRVNEGRGLMCGSDHIITPYLPPSLPGSGVVQIPACLLAPPGFLSRLLWVGGTATYPRINSVSSGSTSSPLVLQSPSSRIKLVKSQSLKV